MTLNQWDSKKIKQHKKETGQALLSDEQSLVLFSQDFGKLIHSQPAAVFIPQSINSLQSLITFAKEKQLPITIRGNGLSQGGQSLPVPGGLTICMHSFNNILDMNDNVIWVEANASWKSLLEKSLLQNKAPFVLPYNCNLSIGGVLSAGGIGASSFKYGVINTYVFALEVIDGLGNKQIVEQNSPLFQACLSGQGRYGVITKAAIQLRPVKPRVKTFLLVYIDQNQWFEDIYKIQSKVDYMELFCSPAMQGTKLKDGKRIPVAYWLYGLHLSVEYDKKAENVLERIKPWKVINTQEESILSYFLRHDSRFEMMKLMGQWDLLHPWYECFVSTSFLKGILSDLLEELPLHYASLVHIVPIAKRKAGFMMLPDSDSICEFMILNPGVPYSLKESCLNAIVRLDQHLIQNGGKRYLSGFMGKEIPEDYWVKHFGEKYNSWVSLKKQYDPVGIFSSMLHPL
ncbi:cytochrome C oxidase subunit III [Legionella norrlandica]|uniref:Cytochrome C oxidase subunit III n=1 Tax=Legionella norrlandica TaxID=1498499 RepID=A0A0A2T9N0_9GAMM|nr:FAD-binding protein [Legionella norrlandica]KGP64133.1 cytochrome C oxidase subunit III [Legionella norrlandica]